MGTAELQRWTLCHSLTWTSSIMQRQAATAREASIFTYTFLFRFPLLKKIRVHKCLHSYASASERLFDGSKCETKKPQRIQTCEERSTKGSSKSEAWRQKQRKVAVLLAKVTVVWGLTASGCATLQANLCTSARAKRHPWVWVAQKPIMQGCSHTITQLWTLKNRMWKRNVGCQSKFS